LLNWHKTTITRSLTQKPHDVAELQAPSSFYFAIDYIGMQGQLWSELIRTTEQLEYMTFPRLQALAERAWHHALWEKTGNVYDMKRDWIEFANTLGYREFPRMEKLGVRYRLPPPGAM
jgi:hexosaminidase